MQRFGDLTFPTPPAGSVLDDNAKAIVIANLRAMPAAQQAAWVDVADALDEGKSRRLERIAMGAAGGLVIGAVAAYAIGKRKKRAA